MISFQLPKPLLSEMALAVHELRNLLTSGGEKRVLQKRRLETYWATQFCLGQESWFKLNSVSLMLSVSRFTDAQYSSEILSRIAS